MDLSDKKIVALMPMRHSSERVPGKNYRPFGDGKPLFHHMVDVMLACPLVEKIVIDTDSPDIKEQCAEKYPQVIVLDRPEHLRDGATPMNKSPIPMPAENSIANQLKLENSGVE